MGAGNFGSPVQLLILLVIVLLLFGGKRLRNLGGDLGSAIKGFKISMGSSESEAGTAHVSVGHDIPLSRVIDAQAVDAQAFDVKAVDARAHTVEEIRNKA